MVLNNRGQASVYAIAFMLSVIVIILALAFAPVVNEITTKARNTTSEVGGMDCSNSSIDDFTSAGCLATDIGQGTFILSVLAIAGTVIAARVVFA